MSDTLLVILIIAIGFLAVILSLAVSKSLTVVIKTLLMVCRMFTGGIDIDSVSRTPLFANEAVVTLFWVGHFMAFYMTASTAVKVLGRRVLKPCAHACSAGERCV